MHLFFGIFSSQWCGNSEIYSNRCRDREFEGKVQKSGKRLEQLTNSIGIEIQITFTISKLIQFICMKGGEHHFAVVQCKGHSRWHNLVN